MSVINREGTIKALPDWTPCEVALPKESGLYLVTETAIIDDYIVTMRYFNRTDDLVCWSGHEYHANPIAWMELPRPFYPRGEIIMSEYKYGMRLRGFSPGCQPKDGFIGREDDPSGRYYDIIVYERPLIMEEIMNYELDYLGEID